MAEPTPVDAVRNPYPGLRPFRTDEERLFFGREHQVDRMIDKLAANRFLAVVGGSGSGKSSLVNCGLRPALHRGNMASAGASWRMAQFRPGGDPIGALARALAAKGLLFEKPMTGTLSAEALVEATLRLGSLGLVDMVDQVRLPAGTQVLVVVDQFEELFRFRSLAREVAKDVYGPAEDAVAFVKLLLEARAQTEAPIHVVLTMRSDFLGDCSQFPGLPEAINEGQYLVPRLTRDEIRAAIIGPAAVVADATISSVLVTRLLNDVGDNPDQLSILQHGLNRTWNQWERSGDTGPLDLPHYQAIGTMAHALDQHAEKAYEELTTARQQQICEKLFKALTDKATDPRGVRRPTKMGTLCALADATQAEVTQVIDVFRKPSRSFLMPPVGDTLEAETVIDISHESLMRVWERLKTWAVEEAQSAQTYCRLAETAVLYRAGEAALWRDPDLQMALDWRDHVEPNEAWARRYHPEFDAAIDFLEKSKKQQHEETAEREREQRERIEQAEALAEARHRQLEVEVRSASRLRRLVAALVVLISLVAVMGFLNARKERALRREEEAKLRTVKAGNVNSQILAQLYKILIGTDPEQARKNALEIKSKLEQARAAYQQDDSPVGEGITLNNIAGFHRLLAESYSAIQDYKTAETYYQQSHDYYLKALEILEKELGSEHTDVATSLTGLATIDAGQGKYAEAEPLLERSLTILSNALDPNDRYLADAIMNLAECYNNQGKYDQAELLYNRALEIRRNKLRSNHPDLAESSYALGWSYYERGKYFEAEPLFKQALAIWEQESDKRDAATGLDALSALYRDKGNLAEAERYLDLAWQIHQDFEERDPLSVAYHLENTGLLYDAQDNPDAETAYNAALAIWTKALGKDHPIRAFGLSNLAFFYYKHARYADAERLFNDALTIQQALPFFPGLAKTSYGLARLYTDQGKYPEAEPLFKQALAIQEKAIPGHSDFAATLNAYADLLSKTDRSAAADEMRNRAEQIRQVHVNENPN